MSLLLNLLYFLTFEDFLRNCHKSVVIVIGRAADHYIVIVLGDILVFVKDPVLEQL